MTKVLSATFVIVSMLLLLSFTTSAQSPVWASHSAKVHYSSTVVDSALRTDLRITASTTSAGNTAYVVTYNEKPVTKPTAAEIVAYVQNGTGPAAIISRRSLAMANANTVYTLTIQNVPNVYTISYFVARNNTTGALSTVVEHVASLRQKGKQMGSYYFMEYLPDGYESGDAYPLMIFLHGYGERGSTTGSLERLIANGPPKRIHNDGKNFPFVILSPQSPGQWDVENLNNFLEEAKRTYTNIDTSRIYMTGLSMGGFGTWKYALTYPEKLAAIAPISGGSGGSFYLNKACNLKDKPIWAFHDDPDELFEDAPTSGTTDLYDRITACEGYTNKMRMTLQENWLDGQRVAKHHAWNLAYSDNPSPKNPDPFPSVGTARFIKEYPSAIPDGETIYSWLLTHRLPVPEASNAFPGKIEAENYTTASGIRVQTTTDEGGGQNIGYIDPGDYMEYHVNVQSSGAYVISYRVARQATGTGSFNLTQNGSVLHTVTVPNTTGWQRWITVNAMVNLTDGLNTLRIEAVTGAWNINYFEGHLGQLLPGKIEAESFDATSGVLVQNTTDTGGGFNVGNIEDTDWMSYNVYVPTAGTYTFTYRVASNANGTGKFELKSGNIVLHTATVPFTSGWQKWVDVQQTANLDAGSQVLTIQATRRGWNMNWFSAINASGARLVETTALAQENEKSVVSLYPNPAQSELRLSLPSESSSSAEVRIIDTYGSYHSNETFLLEKGKNDLTLTIASIPTGSYIVEVVQDRRVVLRKQLMVVK